MCVGIDGHGIQAFPGAKGQVFYGNIIYKTGDFVSHVVFLLFFKSIILK
jgi:hypothetical protein